MVPGGLLGSPAMGALAGIIAGLASACSFGSGDFAGGLASRRAGGLRVAAAVQVVGLLALLVVLLVVRPPLPAPGPLLVGIAAGIAGGIGLAALYAGLAIGAMGLAGCDVKKTQEGSVTVPKYEVEKKQAVT